MDISYQFERTIEISAVVSEGFDPLTWEEVAEEVGLSRIDRELIQTIGAALEDREI